MNDISHTNEDERFLAPFIASAREAADDVAVEQAANRVRERLPLPVERRSAQRGPRFAAAAVLIAGLAVTFNLLVPGGSGTAFADVQAWFSNYRTLDVRTSLTFGDRTMTTVSAQTTADGNARIEQSGIVHIINRGDGKFVTLLPDERYFVQPIEGYRSDDRSLQWVEKLRAFRGSATALDETSVIDGRVVAGHSLVIDDIDLLLWSDVDSNQPVLLEGELPGGLQIETRFLFDVPLERHLFEVPAGFQSIGPEQR